MPTNTTPAIAPNAARWQPTTSFNSNTNGSDLTIAANYALDAIVYALGTGLLSSQPSSSSSSSSWNGSPAISYSDNIEPLPPRIPSPPASDLIRDLAVPSSSSSSSSQDPQIEQDFAAFKEVLKNLERAKRDFWRIRS